MNLNLKVHKTMVGKKVDNKAKEYTLMVEISSELSLTREGEKQLSSKFFFSLQDVYLNKPQRR